jgi:autoinducer 2-degrading protein
MIAKWIKVTIKPERRADFLAAIEVDALGSEQDEPGCVRFNVLQDDNDENVYYFYEVYVDEAAVEAHREAPHYAIWRAAADTLAAPVERIECRSVFPSNDAYWRRNK